MLWHFGSKFLNLYFRYFRKMKIFIIQNSFDSLVDGSKKTKDAIGFELTFTVGDLEEICWRFGVVIKQITNGIEIEGKMIWGRIHY